MPLWATGPPRGLADFSGKGQRVNLISFPGQRSPLYVGKQPEGTYKQIGVASGEGNDTPLQYSCLENPMDGGAWWAAVHRVSKSQTWLSDFTCTFHFYALEKEMATHSSVLTWRIPGMGSHRVGHDWSDLAAAGSNRALLTQTGWWPDLAWGPQFTTPGPSNLLFTWIYLCACFWLGWVFPATHGLFSRRSGFSCCGSGLQACRLRHCGAQASLLCGTWIFLCQRSDLGPLPSRWLLNHQAAREDPQEVFTCRNRTVLSILLRLFANFPKGCMDICLDYENGVLVLLCPGPPQNPPFLTSSSTLSWPSPLHVIPSGDPPRIIAIRLRMFPQVRSIKRRHRITMAIDIHVHLTLSKPLHHQAMLH